MEFDLEYWLRTEEAVYTGICVLSFVAGVGVAYVLGKISRSGENRNLRYQADIARYESEKEKAVLELEKLKHDSKNSSSLEKKVEVDPVVFEKYMADYSRMQQDLMVKRQEYRRQLIEKKKGDCKSELSKSDIAEIDREVDALYPMKDLKFPPELGKLAKK